MPCMDNSRDDAYESSKSLQKARDRADQLAQMLCALLGYVQDVYPLANKTLEEIHSELPAWWKKHQEADRKRRLQEQQVRDLESKKQAVLKKLTKADKELLGIKG